MEIPSVLGTVMSSIRDTRSEVRKI